MFRSVTDLRFHGCWHGQDNKVLLSMQHSPLLPSFHLFPCVKRKKVILSEKFYLLLLFTSNNHRSAWKRDQVRQSVKDGGKSLKWPGICNHEYLQDVMKPEGLKKNINNTYAFCQNAIKPCLGNMSQLLEYLTRPVWEVVTNESENASESNSSSSVEK